MCHKFVIIFLYLCVTKILEAAGPCRNDDPEVNACIQDMFNNIKLDSIDPATVPRIPINTTGTFDMLGELSKATIKGLNSIKYVAAKSDLKKLRIDLKSFIKRLDMDSLAEGRGQLIIFPFQLNGKLSSSAIGATSIYKMYFERIYKNNEPYLHLVDSHLVYSVKDAKFDIKDFNSKIMGDIMSRVMNENAVEFSKALYVPVTETIRGLLDNTYRNYFLSRPEKSFFLI